MKLHEALAKIEDGDVLERDSIRFKIDRMKFLVYADSHHQATLYMDDLMADDWAIVPTEPRVKTAKEYWDEGLIHGGDFGVFRSGFDRARDNWRLERDLEYRDLIDAVEVLYGCADHDGVSTLTKAVFDAFRKLKPLEDLKL